MPPYHTPSPSPSPTRDRRAAGARSGMRSASRPRARAGELQGGSRPPSPTLDRRSRSRSAHLDRLRDRTPSQTRSPGRSRLAQRYRSRSRSLSSSPSRSRSRERSRPPQRRPSRLGDDSRRSRRGRSLSSSRSRSSSSSSSRSSPHSPSRSQLRRDHQVAKDKARHEAKKQGTVKASAMFLGAVAVTTYAAHKLWPKGFPLGDKEEWETREVPKRFQKAKEELFEKRAEVHQKFDDFGRRPAPEGRHGRSDSTASRGSSNGRRYAKHDHERLYHEDGEGRRYISATRVREERGTAGPDKLHVDREGRHIEPPPRQEMVYARQETRYRADDAAFADRGQRFISRSREEAEVLQPPARSSRLMLEDNRDRARDMPWQQDERSTLTQDGSSAGPKHPGRENPATSRHEKIILRKETTVTNDGGVSPPGEWERGMDTGRDRGRITRTEERHDVAAGYDIPQLHKAEQEHEWSLVLPSKEIIKERREVVRNRDPSPIREPEIIRHRGPICKVIETREIIRDRPASPIFAHDRDLGRSRERDAEQTITVIEEHGRTQARDASTSRPFKAARDRQPKETVIEHREVVRERAPSQIHVYEEEREYDEPATNVTKERLEVVRHQTSSQYERTREQPKEFRDEISLVRERGLSPPRNRDGTRERRSYRQSVSQIEDTYQDLPLRTSRKSLSLMPQRRGDRESVWEEDVVYL